MESLYAGEIQQCLRHSVIYGGNDRKPSRAIIQERPSFYFVNTDSVTAAAVSHSNRRAMLNFASYLNPGGGFLNGATAQEEMLCRESYLYNILSHLDMYYVENGLRKSRHLYADRAIYSPRVRFIRGDQSFRCDVITCAAPNKKAAMRNGVTSDMNDEALIRRIQFIRDIAEDQRVESLILGAFGCGVFGQNPNDVADAFKFVFNTTAVKNIVMAVPGEGENVEAFRSRFREVHIKRQPTV